MAYQNVKVPAGGEKISIKDGRLQIPDHPIIPFVEGDGIGRDIWRTSVRVFEAGIATSFHSPSEHISTLSPLSSVPLTPRPGCASTLRAVARTRWPVLSSSGTRLLPM